MKSGLEIDHTAEVEIDVTRDMHAAFEGQTVHELYSTSALVHHMEWVSRKIILPYLEDHEEGMGYHVEVSHLGPTLPGMKVKLRATVSDIRENKVICEVEAFNPRSKIARGTITQVIVEKSWLDHKIKELALVHQLSQEADTAVKK